MLTTKVKAVSRIEESSATSPAVVTIVTQKMIREMGYRTIWDILIHTPGFWEIQDVNDKLIGIRGVHSSTNQKFLLLINGRRITENLWNMTDIDYNLSLANVKRIEIIRSPGSAVYGIAALTAVINVVTDDGLNGLQFDINVGDFGYQKYGLSYAKEISDKIKLEVWGHIFHSDGEPRAVSSNEDGAVNRIDGHEIIDRYAGLTGALGANVNHGPWRMQFILENRSYNMPRGSSGQLNWDQIKENHY
jgi:iron complex outermembrane receptor protein